MHKGHVLSLFGTAALAALLGCESASGPHGGKGLALSAKGKGAVQSALPFASTVTDCEGRAVGLSGTLHGVSRIQQDGRGRFHVMLHANFQDLIGIDSAGDTLTGGGAAHVTGVFDTLPAGFADTLVAELVSADGADTVRFAIGVTWTLGPDSAVSISLDGPVIECPPDTGAGDGSSGFFDSGRPGTRDAEAPKARIARAPRFEIGSPGRG